MRLHVGVVRESMTFTDAGEGDDRSSTGTLWIKPLNEELITGKIVLYTLDRYRLLGMLAAARDGQSDEDIFLALDAAALDSDGGQDERAGD